MKFREIIGADEIAFDNEIYKIPCGSIYRWPYKDYHTNKDNFKNFNFLRFRETLNFLMKLFLSLKIILHLKIDLKICQNYLIQA